MTTKSLTDAQNVADAQQTKVCSKEGNRVPSYTDVSGAAAVCRNHQHVNDSRTWHCSSMCT